MKGYTEQCCLMFSTGDSNQTQIENSLIKDSPCEKLLDVKFDHKLTFDQYVNNLCKKANAKLNALVRFVPYMRD